MRWWEELDAPLLGRYRVERLLGQGGMAEVLLARDERFASKRVAIKAPNLDNFPPSQVEELLQRFQREVQRQGNESIVGVVPIFDAGEFTDSRGVRHPFLVMDYLSGGSLGDALGGSSGQRAHRQTVNEVLAWLRPVAATLDRLHARKYLHRDVKPDNILFNADGDPLLADFGIATSLDDLAGGTLMSVMGSIGPGSPGYQSPESLRGEKFAASDQFSLAVTVYEALTARLPVPASTRDGWILALAHWRPVPIAELLPDLPAETAAVIMRGLSGDVQQRYVSCSQFAGALADSIALARAPAPAPAAPVPEPAPRPAPTPVTAPLRPAPAPASASDAVAVAEPRPRRMLWLFVGIMLLALGVIGAVAWNESHPGGGSPLSGPLGKVIEKFERDRQLRTAEQSALTTAVRELQRGQEEVEQARFAAINADPALGLEKARDAMVRQIERSAQCVQLSLDLARKASAWFNAGHPGAVALVQVANDAAEDCVSFTANRLTANEALNRLVEADARVKTAAEKAVQDASETFEILTRAQFLAIKLAPPPADAPARLRERIIAGKSFSQLRTITASANGPDAALIQDQCQSRISVLEAEFPTDDALRLRSHSQCPKLDWDFNAKAVLTLARAIDADTVQGRVRWDASTCVSRSGGACQGLGPDGLKPDPEAEVELALVSDDVLVLTIHSPGTAIAGGGTKFILFHD